VTAPTHLRGLLQRAAGSGFALRDGRGAESGPDFARRVTRLARGLREQGFAPGDRLLVHLEKGRDQVAVLWATALAGGIAVVAHPRLKDAQVRHVLDDASPFGVVTSAVRDLLLADPAALWAGRRVWGSERGGGDPRPLASLEAGAAADALDGPLERDPQEPAILLYSSGSTGPPKGILQSHATLVDGARIVSDYLGLDASDRILAVLALSFDYGLNQVLAGAWVGAEVVLRDYLGGADLVAAVHAERATVLAGVPTVWRDVAAALARDPANADKLQTLRTLTNSGGRWLPVDTEALRAALPGASLHSMYGLTEAFRTTSLPADELAAHPHSVGYPVAQVEALLVDVDTGAVIEGPGVGELVHVGAFVGLGYWNRPEDTARRFRADPRGGGGRAVWSGDLMRRDDAGRLFFEARLDGQLKVDGYRISPDEVVDGAVRCAGVVEAAVVGLEGDARGHRLVLFAVTEDGVDAAAIRRHCRSALPPHLVPADIRLVAGLPRTPHGKVDAVALRGWAAAPP